MNYDYNDYHYTILMTKILDNNSMMFEMWCFTHYKLIFDYQKSKVHAVGY